MPLSQVDCDVIYLSLMVTSKQIMKSLNCSSELASAASSYILLQFGEPRHRHCHTQYVQQFTKMVTFFSAKRHIFQVQKFQRLGRFEALTPG